MSLKSTLRPAPLLQLLLLLAVPLLEVETPLQRKNQNSMWY